MQDIYEIYSCRTCKNETILLKEQVEDSIKNNRYIACPYCNSQRLSKESTTSNLKECIKHSSYKRVGGAIRQVR